jgi:hypothetical protein
MIENFVICKSDGGNYLRDINTINVGDLVWSQKSWSKVIKVSEESIGAIYYETNGGVITAPPSQKVVYNGRKYEIDKVPAIDILQGCGLKSIVHDPQYVMDGLVQGDGSVFKNRTPHTVYLNIGKHDQDYFNSEVKHLIVERQPSTHGYGWKVITKMIPEEMPHLPERSIPYRYVTNYSQYVCSFLRGLFTANGTSSGGSPGLRSTNYKLIRQAQVMLNTVGIRGYIVTSKPRKIKWHNGEYVSKEAYDLDLNYDRLLFYRFIGF